MTTRNLINDYLSSVERIIHAIDPEKLESIIDVMYDAYRNDRQIFSIGNGGGAATSTHFTCDLNKTAIVPGKRRMRAISLVDNTSLVTAWANDTNYTNVFGEQLVNFARPGDVLIGFTASGMSVNIVNAIALANELGCVTIAFVGFDGGTVAQIANHTLHIQSTSYQHIEDVHHLLCHAISNALQDRAREDIGLEASGLADEVQERVRRIYYVRQQLVTEPSHERRILMIPDQMRRTMGFDRAMVFIPEDGRLVLRAAYGTTPGEKDSIELTADRSEAEAVRERRVVTVEQANGRAPDWIRAYNGIANYVCAPIVREDRCLGLLVGGYTDTARSIEASDIQLLQIFATNIRGTLDDVPEPANPIPWRENREQS